MPALFGCYRFGAASSESEWDRSPSAIHDISYFLVSEA